MELAVADFPELPDKGSLPVLAPGHHDAVGFAGFQSWDDRGYG
ncbi:hypothetical protein [Streptomyces montanus]|nr:hypothetical protein [Streptomyces montanus]